MPVFNLGQGPIMLTGDPHPVPGLPAPQFKLLPPFAIPQPVTIRLLSTQIQYSQTVLLNFNGLTWPHISVATLAPSSAIIPPASVWELVARTIGGN